MPWDNQEERKNTHNSDNTLENLKFTIYGFMFGLAVILITHIILSAIWTISLGKQCNR